MNDTVLYEVEGGVATVTLNRPDRLNSMTAELLSGAVEALEEAAADDSVRVVVFTGAGRGFCAGADLTARNTLGEGNIDARIGVLQRFERSALLLHEMPKVTIAAVNGPAAGAGLAWACAADLRFAAASAKFVTAFVNVGLSGDFGGTWTLPRIVGASRARDLYLLSEAIDGAEAERIGLVSRVFPDTDFRQEVRMIAERLAAAAPIALRNIKANLLDAERLGFVDAMMREAERHVRSGATEDAREAGRAFLEKRSPVFKGK
jgi:2-(1,2-epoxy-1,2-dihydrophenyl)acetyl-CoA isomerase